MSFALKKNYSAIVVIYLFTCCNGTNAQQNKNMQRDISVGFGVARNHFTTIVQNNYLWSLGKNKKWSIGTGARFTSSFSKNLYYTTAPALLTTGKNGPGVFFGADILQNIDSILFKKAQIHALNLTINSQYQIKEKVAVGFNIDVIGFSIGPRQKAIYFGNNNTIQNTDAKPTTFNLLLISDNDLGSLNSEFFAKYTLNNIWSVKAAFQFLFTEYTTNTQVQTTPTSQKNDRFRNKSSQFSVAVIYKF